jgi:hypothetical protein
LAADFAKDFEAGMDRFWNERNTDSAQLLRDMGRYFAQFEIERGNLYLELIRVLTATRTKAVLVTTNYDLLIEQAINSVGWFVHYGGPPAPLQNIPVLKIHGSCNFLPNLSPERISGVAFDLRQSRGGSILECGVRCATSTGEILDYCNRTDSLAPALALYSPAKQILFCKEFVLAQQRAWLASLASAARVYVVGLRVHQVDQHVWGPLSKGRSPLYYVGREPEDFVGWARDVGRRYTYVLSDSFEGALPRISNHHGYRART